MNDISLAKNKYYDSMLGQIIKQIEDSKLKAFAEVNKALIYAYWNIGKVLSENASYGKSVVEQLSEDLRMRYSDSKGYSPRNLWDMKRFYESYQKLRPLVAELIFRISWTNHLLILNKTQSDEEKEFYIKMSIQERWSKRELERQLDSSLFERYMLAQNPQKIIEYIPKHPPAEITAHFKDEYILEFLNLQGEYKEKELEQAILNNLRDFFLEFGKSFTFIGSQYALDIGGRENRIDLLFFHRELRCLVAVELKIDDFKAEYVGQMQKYLAALDEKVRLPHEKESIGLILCKSKNHEEVRFALAKTLSPMKVALYRTKLPDTRLIMQRLERFMVDN